MRLRVSAEARSAAYRADGGDGAGWSVRAATVAGVRHRLAGLGPEDAYAWRVVSPSPPDPGSDPGPPRGLVILAVADGVGSVAGSAAASAAAVDAVCDALVGYQDQIARREVEVDVDGETWQDGQEPLGRLDHWREVFATAGAAVAAVGGATTLIVAAIGSGGTGTVARLGDSAAMVLSGCGWRELWPGAGADDGAVPVATAALPGSAASGSALEVAPVTLGTGDVLVLMTDGVANPLRDGPTTVAPALAEALRAPPSPLGLAVVADFSRQGCFDDRTIVGLWAGPDDLGGR